MKAVNIIFYAVWLLLLAIFQPTLIQWIGVFGISPNTFLIFVVAVAFLRGKREAAICGAVFGLAFDLLVGRLVGLSGILFMYIGFGIGAVLENFLSSTGGAAAAIVTFAASLVYTFIYYIAYSMVWGDMSFATALIKVIMPESLYNAVFGFVLFFPIRKSFGVIPKRNIY